MSKSTAPKQDNENLDELNQKDFKKMKDLNYNIIKEVKGKKGDNKFYRVNKDLISEFFLKDKKVLEADIFMHRIFANIITSLSSHQIHPNNENYNRQLDLFNEQFFKTEQNSAINLVLKTKDITQNRRTDRLKKSLEFLATYKSGYFTSKNEKGEEIETFYTGVITPNFKFNKNRGEFLITIPNFWLEKIIKLSNYNETYFNLINNLKSNKHVLFWYWLICLPEIGTEINLKTINEKFELNYKSSRDVCKDFLRPIKKKLDQYSHQSFNFSYSSEKIKIIRYQRRSEEFIGLNNPVSKQTKENLDKTYKVAYIIRRHKINSEDYKGQLKQLFQRDKSVMNESYISFIADCKSLKMKATNYTEESFLKEFQKQIIKIFQSTTTGKHYPNSYPKFIFKN